MQSRVKNLFKTELRGAITNAVVVLDEITPEVFMDYILGLRHGRFGRHLSKSAYGNRRASLFHLFRLHNNTGFSEAYKMELNNLFRGFYRALAQGEGERVAARN